ncbi:S8 family serine peptidase [Clostridium botulinum]
MCDKLSKPPIRIVIIDSGIDTTKSNLNNFVKKSTGFMINQSGYIVEDKEMQARHPHGTAVALIIKNICKNVEFISINILNEELTSDGRVLIRALDEAILYKPDIIHLSLGTTSLRYILPLKRIIRKGRKNNILIVAAVSNNETKSYPASLKGVLGVRGKFMRDYKSYEYKDGFFYTPIDVKNIYEMKELVNGESLIGNSMSAAYLTGHIALIKYQKNIMKFAEMNSYLKFTAAKESGGIKV